MGSLLGGPGCELGSAFAQAGRPSATEDVPLGTCLASSESAFTRKVKHTLLFKSPGGSVRGQSKHMSALRMNSMLLVNSLDQGPARQG